MDKAYLYNYAGFNAFFFGVKCNMQNFIVISSLKYIS
jgi:hypothetical protein